jgi:hypothetical protein
MYGSGPSVSSQLTAQQAKQISARLASLGEQTNVLAEALCGAGFSAFIPYQRFIESFASQPTDLDVHRLYLQERAKAMLIVDGGYQSPLMDRLTDAARKSPLLTDPATEWIARLHIDPCEQKAFVLKVRDKHEYERREGEMLAQRESTLASETARHATGTSKRYPLGMLTKPLRFRFAVDLISQELASLGFSRTRSKASHGAVIVSKGISERYAIGLSIQDPDLFFYSPTQGQLLLLLQVRAAQRLKSVPDSEPGAQVSVSYTALVYGFSTAYVGFQDLDRLETNIKAQLQLYRLIDPVLEQAIAETLT